MEIKVVSIAGDGDSVLRSFQWNNYTYFPHDQAWLEDSTLTFPLYLGRRTDWKDDFPVQDCLHVLKKIRNNAKYLSTRDLLFCDPAQVTVEDRLRYSARWDCVVVLWSTQPEFRDMISRSAIEVLEKQDPSLATELLLLYEQFYDAGYHGRGLYLEAGHLFCAYYYKGLNPLERIKFVSASKAIMVLWRESLQKL